MFLYVCACFFVLAIRQPFYFFFFFFNDTATTEIYTLSLHDALPISGAPISILLSPVPVVRLKPALAPSAMLLLPVVLKRDRKSTRLNSSHGYISYAVFCLKRKKKSQ